VVDRLTKNIRKLSNGDRRTAKKIMAQLRRGDTLGLHTKKLSGYENIYRAKKGRLRVIYRKDASGVAILDVNLRSDTTYKKY